MRTARITSRAVAPLWKQIERMSNSDKLTLINLISSSMIEEGATAKESESKSPVRRFAGVWVGEETAEEILGNIYSGRQSSAEPVALDRS